MTRFRFTIEEQAVRFLIMLTHPLDDPNGELLEALNREVGRELAEHHLCGNGWRLTGKHGMYAGERWVEGYCL